MHDTAERARHLTQRARQIDDRAQELDRMGFAEKAASGPRLVMEATAVLAAMAELVEHLTPYLDETGEHGRTCTMARDRAFPGETCRYCGRHGIPHLGQVE